jgi:hypothetical protein
MRELYTVQPEDSSTITSRGSFKIKHPTLNKYWSLDGDALKVNSGTPVTLTLEKKTDIFENTNPWGALRTDGGAYIRHAGYVMWANPWTPNNYDFAWIFYKQSDGSYQIFNPYPGPSTPGSFVGYDAGADRVLIVNPGDSTIVNWQVEFTTPLVTATPAPVSADTLVSAPGPSPPSGAATTSKGLSGGAIAGIVIGVLIVLAIIIYFMTKSKGKVKGK